MINDDTDIEADDGFEDYSEVTLKTNMDNREKENMSKPMTREKKEKICLSFIKTACMSSDKSML